MSPLPHTRPVLRYGKERYHSVITRKEKSHFPRMKGQSDIGRLFLYEAVEASKSQHGYPLPRCYPQGFGMCPLKIDLISVNPADKVERPKADIVNSAASMTATRYRHYLKPPKRNARLEIPIFLGAFYGLRRSEALGLKWDAIDFQNNTITIRHTVTSCNLDGKHIQIAQDYDRNQVEYENAAPCSCVQREAPKAQGTAGRIQTSMRENDCLQQKVFGVYLRR